MKIIGLNHIGTKNETVRSKSGRVFETGEVIDIYVAPDHTRGSYEYFLSEASRGRLHGCTVVF
jgi:hypothetical protein